MFQEAIRISGKARIYAEQVNRAIIRRLSERRVRHGEAMGDRSPAGGARPVAELVELVECDATGGREQVTTPGTKTARRKMPAVIARMDPMDARRMAALSYADANERLGSVPGASLERVRADGGPGTGDGGAATRIAFAVTVRAVHKVCDDLTAAHGPALAPGNSRGNRRAIGWRELADAICLEGRDMRGILKGAGWSGHRRDIAQLMDRAELALGAIASALGLASPHAVVFGTSARKV